MAGASRFTPEQLEKIRSTLKGNLGDDSAKVLQSLDKRFTAETDAGQEIIMEDVEDETPGKPARVSGQINVARIIQEGKIEKMVETLGQVKENPAAIKALVNALLQGEDTKAFHLVETLSKVRTDPELTLALVRGIVSKKGINPVIEALRHATASQEAMRLLAQNIAENGTVSHIIRAIATVHKNAEVEVVWAMEVIAKGTVEQMLEALNLMDKESTGVIILATGIINHKEVVIGQLVQALSGCKDNAKASSIVATELARRADVNSLVTLLEKYLSDDTDAGEIVVCKLVEKGRILQLLEACRHISANSIAGRILATGIIQRADPEQLLKAYKMLSSNVVARQIIGLDLVKKKGKLMALRDLGKEVLDLVKNQAEIESFAKKAQKRMEWVLSNELQEAPAVPGAEAAGAAKPAVGATPAKSATPARPVPGRTPTR